MWQRPRIQASFRSAAIKIACEGVTAYRDEDGDSIVIASFKVVEQFNPVKDFYNLFPKTILTEIPPLREVNNHLDPKLESQWLPVWRLSGYKFGL